VREFRPLAVLLALALAPGCTGSPTPQGPPVAGPVSSPRDEGDTLVRRGDYAGAVAKYREAIRATPNDVSLRFSLGSALSQLDRHDETSEEFRWVVANGAPGQPEVVMARQWLKGSTSAGAAAAEAVRGDETPTAADAERQAANAAVGTVKGTTVWPGMNPDARLRLEIRLTGDDAGNKDKNFKLHISLGQPFSMPRIPAGAYRILGQSKGVTLWEERIIVAAGKDTTVNFSDANSRVAAKDFPPTGG
jgi:TPR repeat